MTDDRLAELGRLAAAATPGPWHNGGGTNAHSVYRTGRTDGGPVAACKGSYFDDPGPQEFADGAFVAAARSGTADLAAEVRRLRAERDEAAAALRLMVEHFGVPRLVRSQSAHRQGCTEPKCVRCDLAASAERTAAAVRGLLGGGRNPGGTFCVGSGGNPQGGVT